MNTFESFLAGIGEASQRRKMEEILNHIKEKFPQLKKEIKWSQPMFTDHETFIIGFSIAKGHIAIAPEPVVIKQFEYEIKRAGYSYTKNLFRIKWTDQVDYNLIDKIISYNIHDKKDMSKFWR